MHEIFKPSIRYRFIRAVKRIPGLIGYYPMMEASGTVAHNVAPANKNTKNGAINGGVTLAQAMGSKVGAGYAFNGSTGYVDGLGYSLYNQASTKYSVGMIAYCSNWTTFTGGRLWSEGRTSSITPQVQLFNTNNTLSLNIRSDGSVTLVSASTGVCLTNAVPQLIILTDNNGTVSVYVNGTEYAAGALNYVRAGITLDRIGFGALLRNTNSAFFTGSIQHAFTTNTVLTSAMAIKLSQIAGFR